jgi:competence protein ComEC
MLLCGGYMVKRKRNRSLIKIIATATFIILICIFFYNADISLYYSENSVSPFQSSNNNDASNFKPDNTGKFLLYAINTGNSDSILLIDPSGQTMLVDAADDDDFTKIKATLDKYGISKIDILVATHSHDDHIGSMDELIKSVDIGALYLTPFLDETRACEDLLKAVESFGVPKIYAEPAIHFKLGDASVLVLGPENENSSDENNESIVLLISYGETDFLLTGDMEEKESAQILERWGGNVDCEILKVAHHGGQDGSTKAFLDMATPDIAIISCGENNPYGHPDEETLALLDACGADTLRTDRVGDIAILTDGKAFEAFSQHPRP